MWFILLTIVAVPNLGDVDSFPAIFDPNRYTILGAGEFGEVRKFRRRRGGNASHANIFGDKELAVKFPILGSGLSEVVNRFYFSIEDGSDWETKNPKPKFRNVEDGIEWLKKMIESASISQLLDLEDAFREQSDAPVHLDEMKLKARANKLVLEKVYELEKKRKQDQFQSGSCAYSLIP